MINLSHEKFLTQLAQDYYWEKLTIAELTQKYDCSRYLISKYLDEALNSGLVNIQINSPVSRNFQLESQFTTLFGIEQVYILKNEDNPSSDGLNIIAYATQQIQELIDHSSVVGMSWGGTVYNVIEHFQTEINPNVTFTQYLGENMKYSSLAGSTRMVEHAANRLSAHYLTIPAPLYIVDDVIRDNLKKEPALINTFAAATQMDFIFGGFGTIASIDSIDPWRHAKSQIFPGVSDSEIAGMLFGRPYNINGEFLIPKKDTTFGLTLPEILATPRRFAILKSRFKTNAALGALRGKFLTDIVLDEMIARRILLANDDELR